MQLHGAAAPGGRSAHSKPQPSSELPHDPAVLDGLIDRLSCPKCSAGLALNGPEIRCSGCELVFPVHDGIPLLAVRGSAETWADAAPVHTSRDYQLEYEQVASAASYNQAYREQATKRWSTGREHRLLIRLLLGQARSKTLLNIPSGGGRLSETIAAYTGALVEADIALGQLLYAREQAGPVNNRLWMTASAFHIPFKDGSFDGVVCCRLCHHLPTPVERERLVAELLRVARRFVIMTFFDYHSPKNSLRRMRRAFDNKPPKMTMTCQGLSELADDHGAELVESPALAYLFSGHRYALMVKRDTPAQTP
ncbi:MAG: methyltransferase domain-containing protein [Paracoccaceae bacterium]